MGYLVVALRRFRQKVKKTKGCWNWLAASDNHGYGRFDFLGKYAMAHRASYVLFVGDIPEGLTIDHICRHRGCVNPNHLRPMTLRDNILCGENIAAINARKTHCKHGHPFSGENLLIRKNRTRVCRICHKRNNDSRPRIRKMTT